MKKIVITRHKNLVEYLIKEGVIDRDTPVTAHATPELIEGKHVIGVLPHHLSCLTSTYTEVTLRLPPGLRGEELTFNQVKKYAAGIHTYIVNKVA